MIGWEAVDGRALVLLLVLAAFVLWMGRGLRRASADLRAHGLDQAAFDRARAARNRGESAEWAQLVAQVSTGRRDFAADLPQPFDVETADPRTWDAATEQALRVAQTGVDTSKCGCGCQDRPAAWPARSRLSAPVVGIVRWAECPRCAAPVAPGSWECGECGTQLDDRLLGGGF